MLSSTLAFLTGVVVAATHCAILWPVWSILCLGAIALLGWFAASKLPLRCQRVAQLVSVFLLGVFVCFWEGYQLLKHQFPPSYLAKPVIVTGTVISVPEIRTNDTRFKFLVDSIVLSGGAPIKVGAHILLSDYASRYGRLTPQLGDRWQFSVRLRQQRGYWNPGSFDYQAWLLRSRIQATGTILKPSRYASDIKSPKQLVQQRPSNGWSASNWIQATGQLVSRWRAQIAANITQALSSSPLVGLINALVTGMRYEIPESHWTTMRATGTNHLFAISGLHIGFIAGFVYTMFSWIWRQLTPLPLYMPAGQVGKYAALLAAWGYSLLSGFALPTQRAAIMFSVFVVLTLRRRVIAAWYSWCVAVWIILCLDPLVVLTESFWLSFSAVAIIFYSTGNRLSDLEQLKFERLWQKWGHTQWALSIGLIPLSLFFFQQVALAGFVANLIAIPWVGFLVVPLALIGALLSFGWFAGGSFLLMISEKLLSLLWEILNFIAAFPMLQVHYNTINIWTLLTTVIASALYLGPPGFPGRYYLGSVWLLPLLLYKPPTPDAREIWLSLLDVGQGLAVVIQTQQHTLIYDTGPSFGPHFNTGDAVILPFLKATNISQVDMLVVSHADNDHSGGASSLLKKLSITQVLASRPEKLNTPLASHCCRGQVWEWDGVYFEILHPEAMQVYQGNNSSCILRISNGAHSILLPGDIHKRVEYHLLATVSNLNTTLLIAPHHGSNTSSSDAFIQATQPSYVLFPVGYRNRFGFPHSQVQDRYHRYGVTTYSSDKEGAITVKLGVKPNQVSINRYKSQLRFWQLPIADNSFYTRD